MKLLLTGASGFLGRNLILGAPPDWQIAALYCADAAFPGWLESIDRPNVTAVRCDLTSPEQVQAAVRQHGQEWDCCLYLAGKVDIPWSVREPKQDLLANTGSLLNLLESASFGKFVYFSSGAVYDGLRGEVTPDAALSPTLPYAISKLACEHYVRCFHSRRRSIDRFLVLRFFGAYGPYEAPHKIYTRLIRAFALEGKTSYTIYGDGRNLIDAMYVDDAIEGLRRIVTGQFWNATINFASGRPMTIEALVQQSAEALGVIPVTIERQGVAHENIEFRASADMKTHYGFEPAVGLTEGMRRFRDHFSDAGSSASR